MARLWIIRAQLDGDLYAFSEYEGQFALVPIDSVNGIVRKAHAWKTKQSAQNALDQYLKQVPKVMAILKPEVVPMLDGEDILKAATRKGPMQ